MTIKSKLLGGIAAASLALATSLTPAPLLGVSAAQAQTVSVDFNLFFDELQPHGIWVRHSQYRYVWCPTDVEANWAPYTAGRWLYLADYGWYFTSEEPFAWAVYHYGRWFDDDRLGWCWVPGNTWAPAWVTWRRGNDYIGWAPLPPPREGFQISVEVSSEDVPEPYWFFVPVVAFVEPNLRVEIIFGQEQPEIVQETEFLGPVVVEGDLVINNVIEVTYIEEQINQEVIVYETAEIEEPAPATVDLEANTIQVFAPQIEEPTEEAAPAEAVEPEEAAAQIEAEVGAEADAEAPAEGEAPADGEAPAEGEEPAAPVEGEEPAAPAEGEEPAAPVEGEAGAEVEAGAEAGAEEPAAPAEEPAAPAEEPATAEEGAPAEETAPAEEPAPMEEAAPVEEPAPAEEAAPAEETAPAEEPATTEEAAPAEGAVTEETAPVCPPALMVDGQCLCPPETIVDGQCPAEEGALPEAPAGETLPEEAPVEETAPAEAPAQ